MAIRSVKSRPGTLLSVMLTLLLVGCSTKVVNTGTYVPASSGVSAPLPRPQRVIIADFTAEPGDVRLDQGIEPRACGS